MVPPRVSDLVNNQIEGGRGEAGEEEIYLTDKRCTFTNRRKFIRQARRARERTYDRTCARVYVCITTRRKYAEIRGRSKCRSECIRFAKYLRAALPACRFYAEIIKFDEVMGHCASTKIYPLRALVEFASRRFSRGPRGRESRVSREGKKKVERKRSVRTVTRVSCAAPRDLQLIVTVKLQVQVSFFLRYTAVTINHRDEADKRVTSAIPRLTRCGFRLAELINN